MESEFRPSNSCELLTGLELLLQVKKQARGTAIIRILMARYLVDATAGYLPNFFK